MPRRQYIFPEKILEIVEAESKRRLLENKSAFGKRTLGSVARDIICVCVVIAFPKIREMDQRELDEYLQMVMK